MNKYIPTLTGTFFVSGIFKPLDSGSPILPSYMIVFVGILVVFTILTIFLRFTIYQRVVFLANRVRSLIYQETRVQKPKIIQEIERRFQESSPFLDKVNTAALIDQVYSRFLFRNEQLDYFCRSLPNLLLALGLLGTFLGITLNLNELSQTINDFGAGSIDDLVKQVQSPLQGMGVAFISSLTAVACSVVLNIVNAINNTSIAKYQLMSALEDYIDNVYGPSLGNPTPLNKAVDRLENLFEAFVNRFAVSVREAVESSLGEKVQQITEGNLEANQLATQVYNRFLESAGAIRTGATLIRDSAQIFDRSQFANKLSSSTEHLANTQRELSRSALVLNQSSQSIQLAIASLQTACQEMGRLGEEVGDINKQSAQVLSLTQANQQSIGEIVGQLQQGAQIFNSAIATFDSLQKRLDGRAGKLNDVHSELSKLIDILKNYTEEVTGGIKNLGDRLVGAMNEQARDRSSHDQPMATKISQVENQLTAVQSQLAQLVQTLAARKSEQESP